MILADFTYFFDQNKLYTENGRICRKYCKNRAYTLCSSIRKAEIIYKYLPAISTWSAPYFINLTAKLAPKKSLYNRLQSVLRAFRKNNNKYRKRNQRRNLTRLIGIKSLECTFNPVKKTYNPHLHLVVESKEIADTLISEWLMIWPDRYVSPKAQHESAIIDREKALIEIIKSLFKYSSKK